MKRLILSTLLFISCIANAENSISFSGISMHMPGTIDPNAPPHMPYKLERTGTFIYNPEIMYTHIEKEYVVKAGGLKDTFNDDAVLLTISNKAFYDTDKAYLGYGAGLYTRKTFRFTEGNKSYRATSFGQISNGYYDAMFTPGVVGALKINKSMDLEFISNIVLNNLSFGWAF